MQEIKSWNKRTIKKRQFEFINIKVCKLFYFKFSFFRSHSKKKTLKQIFVFINLPWLKKKKQSVLLHMKYKLQGQLRIRVSQTSFVWPRERGNSIDHWLYKEDRRHRKHLCEISLHNEFGRYNILYKISFSHILSTLIFRF